MLEQFVKELGWDASVTKFNHIEEVTYKNVYLTLAKAKNNVTVDLFSLTVYDAVIDHNCDIIEWMHTNVQFCTISVVLRNICSPQVGFTPSCPESVIEQAKEIARQLSLFFITHRIMQEIQYSIAHIERLREIDQFIDKYKENEDES